MGKCLSKPPVEAKLADKYDIQHELGSGAFSRVMQAKNKQTGEVCALKMIPISVFKKNKEATEREVAILQAIGKHKHIVHLLEVIRGTHNFTIAMELLTGGELFERICEREKYTEGDACKVTKQMLEGVAFLHGKNVAHRDLKPENLIFEKPEEEATLKLSDFGFANVYDPANRFVATCGTPLYVAPEIIDGTPYDVQCDMWSLGVIVFILLCGYPPYYGEDDDELFYKISHAQYEFASPNWDDISENAKHFLRRCFELEPRMRITAKQALKHPWLASLEEGKDDGKHLQHAMEDLKRTQCKRKLIKGVHAVVAMNRIKRSALLKQASQ